MSKFAVGELVTIARFSTGQCGTIVAIDGDRARVQLSGLMVTVPLIELSPGDPAKVSISQRSNEVSYSGIGSGGTDRSLSVLDLHGLTTKEAVEKLEQRISQCVMGGFHELEVMHGFGSGAVRDAVHARLASISVVAKYEVKTTNRGVTRVFLSVNR